MTQSATARLACERVAVALSAGDTDVRVDLREGLAEDFPDFYVGALTDRQAEVLAMRYHKNLPYAEIGGLLGISPHAAWRLHKRALAALKRHWRDLHDEPTPPGGRGS